MTKFHCLTAVGAIFICLLLSAGCQLSLNLFYNQEEVKVVQADVEDTEAEAVIFEQNSYPVVIT